jgi:hypothetical protein
MKPRASTRPSALLPARAAVRTTAPYRSTRSGADWTPIHGANVAAVIGPPKSLHPGGAGVDFNGTPPEHLATPRARPNAWKPVNVPAPLVDGAKATAATFDGSPNVLVSGSRRSGIWRYVEP